MLVSEFKGLKYPDEYIIKFFFKEKLFSSAGNILELGCGNGNNLMLFYQYGWNVLGVDINKESLCDASNNFKNLKNKNLKNFEFINTDMCLFLENIKFTKFNAIIIPSSIYYLKYESIISVFRLIKEKELLSENSYLFIRFRSLEDYRFSKGQKVQKNTFILNLDETGEKGCLNTFFSKDSMLKILDNEFNFKYKYVFKCYYENLQNDNLIKNSDYIIWGKISK